VSVKEAKTHEHKCRERVRGVEVCCVVCYMNTVHTTTFNREQFYNAILKRFRKAQIPNLKPIIVTYHKTQLPAHRTHMREERRENKSTKRV
jgi:hypothetical protein